MGANIENNQRIGYLQYTGHQDSGERFAELGADGTDIGGQMANVRCQELRAEGTAAVKVWLGAEKKVITWGIWTKAGAAKTKKVAADTLGLGPVQKLAKRVREAPGYTDDHKAAVAKAVARLNDVVSGIAKELGIS